MDPSLGVAVMIVGLSGATLLFRIARMRPAGSLHETSRSEIASAPDGRAAKLVGRVVCLGEPLVAPVSGRRCVYYAASLDSVAPEARTGSGIEERAQDFVLVDDTGRALVRVAGATFTVGRRVDLDPRENTGESATAFLLRHWRPRVDVFGLGHDTPPTMSEAVIAEGDTVAVFGECAWEMDLHHEAGQRGAYRGATRRLAVKRTRDGTLLVTDDIAVMG